MFASRILIHHLPTTPTSDSYDMSVPASRGFFNRLPGLGLVLVACLCKLICPKTTENIEEWYFEDACLHVKMAGGCRRLCLGLNAVKVLWFPSLQVLPCKTVVTTVCGSTPCYDGTIKPHRRKGITSSINLLYMM